ncbi:MAG TPA: hypothetical protein VMY18_11640 [Acidobacteriota bacterium]|nr:hypothetical protein [Acidobacteriota bacterium]
MLEEARQEIFHGFPHFLPDGEHFLYAALSERPQLPATRERIQQDPIVIKLGSLSTGGSRVLLNEISALVAPPGYLLFRTAEHVDGTTL